MAKGDVKKWRKNVDSWRNKVNDRFDGVDGWLENLDGRLKKLEGWTSNVDIWRRSMDTWRTSVSVNMACMKEDIYCIRESMEDMYTKKEHNELMTRIDSMFGEVQESRRERQVQGYRFSTMDDQVNDHEKRIGVLEKKA